MNNQRITSYTDTREREFPWVTLGTTVDQTMTVKEALQVAGLDGWNVHKQPLMLPDGTTVPDRVATVRDLPEGGTGYLGTVGNRYQTMQNETVFGFMDDILDTSDLTFSTAGEWGGGRRVFLTAEIPEGALQPALDGALSSWTIRHTHNMDGRMLEARESLGLSFTYLDQFSREMNTLLDRSVSDVEFDRMVERLIPDPQDASEGWMAATREKRQTIGDLYRYAPTNEYGRGTAYGAFNAMTEYADHLMPVKGKARGEQVVRAERAMSHAGASESLKRRAWELVTA